ncbi:MAG: diguanylate cyclase [Azoarcus sp.]|jgi:diguanylate cyclase (GGDEF)-like protein/PAS domain S-box-containing protein|nr:diguanylate cyclase [Azoarcus sp.]
MPYRIIVLLTSIILTAIVVAVGGYMYWQVDKRFEIWLAGDTARLHHVYIAQNEVLVQHLQALAYSLAADHEIQRLIDEGGMAWHAAGGHDGMKARQARQALRTLAQRRWEGLSAHYGVETLHFLLPGNVSFLRMHAPEFFGDVLSARRPMLADTARDFNPRSGFVIGTMQAGLRGVVEIMRDQPGGGVRNVGLLEIGFDMKNHLNKLSEQLGIDIALLLDPRRVAAIRPKRRPGLAGPRDKQSAILAATHPEAEEWLSAGLNLQTGTRVPQSRLLSWRGSTFQVVTFALDDYLSQTDPARDPAGTVLIWRDATTQAAQRERAHTAVIHGTLSGYAILQILVFVLLSASRREWERQLKENTKTIEKLLRRNALLLDTAADGICGVDRDGRINFINRAALDIYNCRAEDVTGKDAHALFPFLCPDGDANSGESSPLRQTLDDGEARMIEERIMRGDGSFFPAEITIRPIREHGRKDGAVVVFHDISEQYERQEALLRLATTDPLTGASNRRHFLDQLDAEMARQRRHGGSTALLMADLDYFKRVNDHYGHAAGDAALCHFVRIARQTVRRSDIIGRLGGEEFAILLPGDDIAGASELAERLRHAVEINPVKIGNVRVPVTVSIGISRLQDDDRNAETPLHRADEALYAAKNAGRNRSEIYNPAWREEPRQTAKKGSEA